MQTDKNDMKAEKSISIHSHAFKRPCKRLHGRSNAWDCMLIVPDPKSRNASQNFFNPYKLNNVSFYCLIKHWTLHIACILRILHDWKFLFFLKFCDCFVTCGSALDPLRDLQHPPLTPTLALTQSCFKNGSSFFS